MNVERSRSPNNFSGSCVVNDLHKVCRCGASVFTSSEHDLENFDKSQQPCR